MHENLSTGFGKPPAHLFHSPFFSPGRGPAHLPPCGMHSYHGNSPDFREDDDDECLLKEAGKSNISKRLPPNQGRSHSSDATNLAAREQNQGGRNNWRAPRKSFGENQIRSLPPRPDASSPGGGNKRTPPVRSNSSVAALVNKIQHASESHDDDIPQGYGISPSSFSHRKFSRGSASRDGNISLSEDCMLDDNDDPLYEPGAGEGSCSTVRRAGMSQNREGRAYLSRKNSFNSMKQAKDSGRMGEHERDRDTGDELLTSESRDDPERTASKPPRGKPVQRSTSRVKMMAQSLQQRETAVKKTEEMIANHQPLDLGGETSRSRTNLAEDRLSVGGSPANVRKKKPETNKQDDSFIKELLEIARAESQEKQKGPEITFTSGLLKNTELGSAAPEPIAEGGASPNLGGPSSPAAGTGNGGVSLARSGSSASRRGYASQDHGAGTDGSQVGSPGGKPKDFKDAIAIASTRIANKKNSKDCSLERELDQDGQSGDNHDDLLANKDSLIHDIKAPRAGYQGEKELPYSTVTSGVGL